MPRTLTVRLGIVLAVTAAVVAAMLAWTWSRHVAAHHRVLVGVAVVCLAVLAATWPVLPPIARFVSRRIGLGLITLFLLSVLVFAVAQLLPGDPAQTVAGTQLPEAQVKAIDHALGVDHPWYVLYWRWVSGIVHFNFGNSFTYGTPVRATLHADLVNSLKLAAVAFAIVVPLSILGGVVSALRYGRPVDRIITLTGLSGTVIPEFVSGIVFIIVFATWLKWLPGSASWGPGAGPLTQIKHLLLPALPLVLVLFGYIARITRAGVIEALDADYTRTAYLKGVAGAVVIRRHVLPNGLLPTIAVVATQLGYLIGGLVIVETLFTYQGIGQMILTAANSKDYPTLDAGVMTIGAIYLVATLAADLMYALLNPRIRESAYE